MSDPRDKPSALDDMAGKAFRRNRMFQELTAQLLEVWFTGPECDEGYEKWKREVRCNPLLEPWDRTVLFNLASTLLE